MQKKKKKKKKNKCSLVSSNFLIQNLFLRLLTLKAVIKSSAQWFSRVNYLLGPGKIITKKISKVPIFVILVLELAENESEF